VQAGGRSRPSRRRSGSIRPGPNQFGGCSHLYGQIAGQILACQFGAHRHSCAEAVGLADTRRTAELAAGEGFDTAAKHRPDC
jgi:hypothetical protein